jgi:hypothetical protein
MEVTRRRMVGGSAVLALAASLPKRLLARDPDIWDRMAFEEWYGAVHGEIGRVWWWRWSAWVHGKEHEYIMWSEKPWGEISWEERQAHRGRLRRALKNIDGRPPGSS